MSFTLLLQRFVKFKSKKILLRIILVPFLLGFFLSGCGQSRNSEVQTAPQSPAQLGWLVKGVTRKEVVDFLSQHPDGQYRTLSERHLFFEIYHAPIGQFLNRYPQAEVSANTWVRAQEEPQAPPPLSTVPEVTQGSAPDTGNCKTSAIQPKPKIDTRELDSDPSAKQRDFREKPLYVGETLAVSGAKSQAHPSSKGPLRMLWKIVPPESSKLGERESTGLTASFTPDVGGTYFVALMVQDVKNVCARGFEAIPVTVNKKLEKLEPIPLENLITADVNFPYREEMQFSEIHKISQGEGVTIAILDSGVNYNSPLLNANIFINEKEIPDNKIDDDENGFVDDAYGYDFFYKDAYPFDDFGHGSHVAGLAASPLFGMAPKAKILPVKVMGPGTGGDVGSIIAGLYYAIDMGAKVANLSLGNYGSPSPGWFGVMDYATSKGVLVVVSSGNGNPQTGQSVNIDKVTYFPGALPHKNLITVTAKDRKGFLANYANFGVRNVDVIAPGGNAPEDLIFSANLENPTGKMFVGMSGTSMATPLVAGLVANLISYAPEASADFIKEALMKAGPEVPRLKTIVQSSRWVDGVGSLDLLKQWTGLKKGKIDPIQ